MSNPFLGEANKTAASKMKHSSGKGSNDQRAKAKQMIKGYADGGSVLVDKPPVAMPEYRSTAKVVPMPSAPPPSVKSVPMPEIKGREPK